MTVLSGQSIRRLGILSPCHERTEVDVTDSYGDRKVSYGLGPAGYDLRLDTGIPGAEEGHDYRVLSPGGFLLSAAQEHFVLPPNILGVVHDKSSWARLGLTVQNTIVEPGWRGYLTLELHNHSDRMLYLWHGVGIAQIIFHALDEPSETPYNGKYQDQAAGPQGAR